MSTEKVDQVLSFYYGESVFGLAAMAQERIFFDEPFLDNRGLYID